MALLASMILPKGTGIWPVRDMAIAHYEEERIKSELPSDMPDGFGYYQFLNPVGTVICNQEVSCWGFIFNLYRLQK